MIADVSALPTWRRDRVDMVGKRLGYYSRQEEVAEDALIMRRQTHVIQAQ